MRKILLVVLAALAICLGWFGIWYSLMAGDVARVEASIRYHHDRLKATNRAMVLKTDGVSATGFPFRFRIKVAQPKLSMIQGTETYAVSFPEVYLEARDADQGRYELFVPATFEALYATDGGTPENYRVMVSELPKLLLRAQEDSQKCSGFPGAGSCPAVASNAPLISYAASLPASLLLHMELGAESRDARFNFMAINVPIFQTIPENMDYPLTMFVGVLREALVFKTGSPK